MGRPRLYTPEERAIRDRESSRRAREKRREQARADYNERYPTRYKAKAKARHDARMAAMTPEELDAYRAYQAAAQRRSRAKDPEAARSKAKALRLQDPEKHRAYVKKHRLKQLAANPHYNREQYEKQKTRNPAQITEASARRRARLRGVARNDVTPAQRTLVIASAHGRCVYCPHYHPTCTLCPKGLHEDLTVDHITAVYHKGDNTLHNLVACCAWCNSKKKISPNPVPVQPLLL